MDHANTEAPCDVNCNLKDRLLVELPSCLCFLYSETSEIHVSGSGKSNQMNCYMDQMRTAICGICHISNNIHWT